MGEYFDDIHASCETELRGLPCGINDSPQVAEAKAAAADYEGYMALGKSLSMQLRYREAAEAYSYALLEKPDDPEALRLRAGRHLSTLQAEKAYADFAQCLILEGEELDLKYRLGLCDYYARNYPRAMESFEACLPIADEEMGIAVIYWHTMCAYRSGEPASLLTSYHTGMEVGHHFAYEKAVRVCAGACSILEMLTELEKESEDLHYTITAYGLSLYLRQTGAEAEGHELLGKVLVRNSFWPCYAYLAAWNDENVR